MSRSDERLPSGSLFPFLFSGAPDWDSAKVTACKTLQVSFWSVNDIAVKVVLRGSRENFHGDCLMDRVNNWDFLRNKLCSVEEMRTLNVTSTSTPYAASNKWQRLSRYVRRLWTAFGGILL